MTILVCGVLLFAVVHLIPSLAQGLKASWVVKMGENGYKGIFSLLLLASFGLIIYGWRHAVPEFLYVPPAALRLPALALVVAGFFLFIISNRASRVRLIVRHPQLTGVLLWSLAHLMLNGDTRSLVLFGGLAVWAVIEIPAINRRDGVWIKGDAPPFTTELVSALITLIVVGLVAVAHPWLSGVPIIPG